MALEIEGTMATEVKKTNKLEITNFIVNLTSQNMIIIYLEKSDDTVIKSGQVTLEGDDFLALIGQNPNGNISFFENIKNALYSVLQSQLGISGTVV